MVILLHVVASTAMVFMVMKVTGNVCLTSKY